MNFADIPVLVVGTGSIGRRHLRNLRNIGVTKFAVCDPEAERVSAACAEVPAQAFASLESALQRFRPAAVFICTPPSMHVQQALQAVRAGAHVFLEKPLSHTREGIDTLREQAHRQNRIVQVGYNLRWHPGLRKLKELLDQGEIGRVLYLHAEFGQYLPDWRPAQDYRQNYTARRDLGGGIILDDSHEIDYVLWLLGNPVEIVCMAGKVSDLAVDVEDCATILLRFAGGAHADIHMDFVQRGYHRSCKIAGELGNLLWDFAANEVRLYRAGENKWTSFPYQFEANDMYVAEANSFLEAVAGGGPAAVTLEEGARVLDVALRAIETASLRTAESAK